MHILMLHGVNHNMFGRRAPFRHVSVFGDIVKGRICVFGLGSDLLALFFSLRALLWWLPASAAHVA